MEGYARMQGKRETQAAGVGVDGSTGCEQERILSIREMHVASEFNENNAGMHMSTTKSRSVPL